MPLARPHGLMAAALGFGLGEALLFSAVEAAASGWRAAAWTAAARVLVGVPVHMACSAVVALAWLRADSVRSALLVVYRARTQFDGVARGVLRRHGRAYREAALEANGRAGWASWVTCSCVWAGCCCWGDGDTLGAGGQQGAGRGYRGGVG